MKVKGGVNDEMEGFTYMPSRSYVNASLESKKMETLPVAQLKRNEPMIVHLLKELVKFLVPFLIYSLKSE